MEWSEEMGESPQGRRVLVAIITGDTGERIQAWRERHDPRQARRLPPHITLCYWLPDVSMDLLGQQVRHALPGPVSVRLGGVREFDNVDRTFYVEVRRADALTAVRERLFDGTFVELPGRDRHWAWHVTCVRNSVGQDIDALRAHARELTIDADVVIDTVACLELRGDRYHEVQRWQLEQVAAQGDRML